MLKKILLAIFVLGYSLSFAQEGGVESIGSAERLLQSDSRLSIGGYAQVDYNQPFGGGEASTGTLDVHRLVMLFAYRFNEKTSFITEIEFEHVSEVFVEQAFLQYRLNNSINLRGGLLLAPMGLINELHEPPSFNGVERPEVDKYISPTTWREIGLGLSGNITSASIKYQAYIMNGFNGYDGAGRLDGKNGLRKGRQKGAESFMSSPNYTFRTQYYGVRGLSLGLSGYFGNTQSTLKDGLDPNDTPAVAAYDSSRVGINMLGADFTYDISGFQVRGQLYYNSLTNTAAYNSFTSIDGTPNDLGSRMTGYYLEIGYNIFSGLSSVDAQLIPFIRYEGYNTHAAVEGTLVADASYMKSIITSGLTLKLAPGAVAKCDLQFMKDGIADSYSKIFNAGIGVMF